MSKQFRCGDGHREATRIFIPCEQPRVKHHDDKMARPFCACVTLLLEDKQGTISTPGDAKLVVQERDILNCSRNVNMPGEYKWNILQVPMIAGHQCAPFQLSLHLKDAAVCSAIFGKASARVLASACLQIFTQLYVYKSTRKCCEGDGSNRAQRPKPKTGRLSTFK